MDTLARRVVALLVLVVLCAAPALATTCELLCDAAARAARAAAVAPAADSAPVSATASAEAQSGPAPAVHHGASCHESAPADGPQVSTGRADCAFHHGGAVQGFVALTAARADADVAPASVGGASAAPADAMLAAVRASRPWLAPPPGPPPSSRRPLVLRI